jgi:hypothetical protein
MGMCGRHHVWEQASTDKNGCDMQRLGAAFFCVTFPISLLSRAEIVQPCIPSPTTHLCVGCSQRSQASQQRTMGLGGIQQVCTHDHIKTDACCLLLRLSLLLLL